MYVNIMYILRLQKNKLNCAVEGARKNTRDIGINKHSDLIRYFLACRDYRMLL